MAYPVTSTAPPCTSSALSSEPSYAPLLHGIAAAAGAARSLFEPAILGRLLTYAELILPALADALGCGPLGQVTTQIAVRLVRNALLDEGRR
ncbi:hypothetical protein FNH05_32835 [Amycolatopsis rhizosphaerae]|uniref:Uncharacterized protein n=1 Tax=Amycolatopsis rhizosphaerae TaxID=2053003 RepID=A0A558AHM1_9PSEU|nr:hypothetical protein [Amycolatopsis rhizosphaerae]TVT23768.1 hypothetical protein FNH05_32835 [Amycolatopsis rhizosphaerae]